MKMTAKDVKEITYMPLVTFFSVLEPPGKTVRGLQQPPPLGLTRVKGMRSSDLIDWYFEHVLNIICVPLSCCLLYDIEIKFGTIDMIWYDLVTIFSYNWSMWYW